MFSEYHSIPDFKPNHVMSAYYKYFTPESFSLLGYDMNAETILQDLESKAPEFEIDEEIAKLRRETSRLERMGSQPEPDICLIKRASSKDIKELVSLDCERSSSEDKLNEEALSHSTAESTEAEKLCLTQVAIRMNEENFLRISDFSGEFGQFERLFIANILLIKKGSSVGWDLTNEQFVKDVNAILGQNRERRKDDRLRFIYKRAIKCLLAQCTEYHSNKSYRMEDFTDQFIRHYFGKKNNINHDVLDTSYASCKKLKLYFSHSEAFKVDFIELALDKIMTEYAAYTADQYYKMFSLLKTHLESGRASDKILFSRFKRIPWSASDIQMSVNLIRDLAK